MSNTMIKCFVIMPFTGTTVRHTTEYWTEFYEGYLKPFIEKKRVKVYRSEALRGDLVAHAPTPPQKKAQFDLKEKSEC